MHHELLARQILYWPTAPGGGPVGVTQGGIVGERSHGPFGVGRTDKLVEGGFRDGVKHAARAPAARAPAGQRDIGRQLIPVARARKWRSLGEGGQRAVPDGRGRCRQRREQAGQYDHPPSIHASCFHIYSWLFPSSDRLTLARGNKPGPTDRSNNQPLCSCLLYTSDAADDLLCVDLGG